MKAEKQSGKCALSRRGTLFIFKLENIILNSEEKLQQVETAPFSLRLRKFIANTFIAALEGFCLFFS